MDTRKPGLLDMMFGNMEYMVENRDKMQRMADEYSALRNAMGRAPTEQELGFFLRNRMIGVDPSSVTRPLEDTGFYGRSDPSSVVRGREDTGFYGRSDPSSVVRDREDTGFYGRGNNFERMMYPDANERALELRDQMRSLERRAARPQDYTGAAGMDAMSQSAGGIEGLMRYNQMMRNLMPRGVR